MKKGPETPSPSSSCGARRWPPAPEPRANACAPPTSREPAAWAAASSSRPARARRPVRRCTRNIPPDAGRAAAARFHRALRRRRAPAVRVWIRVRSFSRHAVSRETPRAYLHPADSCQPPLTGRARLHLSLHPVQTAAEARLDRGKRQLEHAGDLLELHLFFKAQREYLAVDDRQIGQRTGNKPGALLVEQTVERRRTIRSQPRLARLAGRIAHGRLVQALRTVAPQMVNRQIPRHRKQPGVEIAAGIKTLDALGDAQPGLLKQIFGQGRLAHQPQQVTIEPVLIAR